VAACAGAGWSSDAAGRAAAADAVEGAALAAARAAADAAYAADVAGGKALDLQTLARKAIARAGGK
jgi:hypothetical protein